MKRSTPIVIIMVLIIGIGIVYAYSRLSVVSFNVQGASVTYMPPKPLIRNKQGFKIVVPGARRAAIQAYGWMPDGSLKLLATGYAKGDSISLSVRPILTYLAEWSRVLGVSRSSPRPGVLLVGLAEGRDGLHLIIKSIPLDLYLATRGYSITINLGAEMLSNKGLLLVPATKLGKYIEPRKYTRIQGGQGKTVSNTDSGFPPDSLKICYQRVGDDDTVFHCYVLRKEKVYAKFLDKGLPIILTHVSAHNSLRHLHHIDAILHIDYSDEWSLSFDFNVNVLVEKHGAEAGYSYEIAGPGFQLPGGRLWIHYVAELNNHAYDEHGRYINLDNVKEVILALGTRGDAAVGKYSIKECKSYLGIIDYDCKNIGDFYVALLRPRISNGELVPWKEVDLSPERGSTIAAKAYNAMKQAATLYGTKVAYGRYDHYVFKNENAQLNAPGSLTASIITPELLGSALSRMGLTVPEALPLLVFSVGPSVSLHRIGARVYLAESIISLDDYTTPIVAGYYHSNTEFVLMAENKAYYIDSMYIDAYIDDAASHIYGGPGYAS